MNQEVFARKTRFLAGLIPAVLVVWMVFDAFTMAPRLHLLALHFNSFAILSAVALVINVGLMIYFYTKPARTEERNWLFIYMLAAAVFTAAEMMQRLSINPSGALFWGDLVTVASILPTATFMFALSYTNPSERRFPWLTAVLVVFPLIYTFFVAGTDIVYLNTDPAKLATLTPWGWDFNQNGIGPAAAVATIWYVMLNGLALVRLIGFRRHSTNPILKRQSLIFIWAFVLPVAFSAVSLTLLPLVGVDLPPFTTQVGDMALILLVYGVVRYQLLTVSPTLFSGTILSIIEESVVVTDDHFNIVYLNPKAQTMLGVRGSGGGRTSLLSVMQPSTSEQFQSAFNPQQAAKNSAVDIGHIDLHPVHASPVPVRVTGSRLQLPDLPMWVMALSDITKELQTRSVIEQEVQVRTKELQEARAYLLSSINSLEQGFVLLNAKFGVEVMNRAARTVFKVKQDDSSPLALGQFAANTSWNRDLTKTVERVVLSKRFHKLDVETADGSFLQVFVSPVLLSDHVLGVAVIIQDVTEQRILDRSKDEFFSIASHELRTPLTAIRGNMSMLQDYFPEALKDQSMKDLVGDTHAASVRLIEIVNDFLDSSRLEQGKMVFNFTPVAVAPLVLAVKTDLQLLATQQHNTVVLDGLDKLPKVEADEARLRQIFYNLMSNANKYSENAKVTISGVIEGKNVRIRIADSGKGISPENQKLLFHKFQQASASILTRDNTKGTGLGLYIARLLADNMHGNVELEHTEEGKGTTFAIILPIATGKTAAAKTVSAAA